METSKILSLLLTLLSISFLSPAYGKDFDVDGSLSQRYRLRTTGGFSDNDMETMLTLNARSASDKFEGFLQMSGLYDLDANPPNTPFVSVTDSFGGRAAARLYYAYMDIKDTGPFQVVRTGRQHRYEFESLYFDGIDFETKSKNGFTFGAYSGVPVHLYETPFGFDPGDWLIGTAVTWTPVSNFQARGDFVHLKDKLTGFRAAAGDLEDNLFGLETWWDVTKRISLETQFTSFSDQLRDVTSRLTYNWVEKTLAVNLNFYRLLTGTSIRVIDADPYGSVGGYNPYTEAGLDVSKGIGKHFFVDGGGAFRFLDQNQVASAFNHGYSRFFLSGSTLDFPIDGMSLSTTLDYYKGRDNVLQNDNFGLSFDVTQKFKKGKSKLSLGTSYSLYHYNLFTGNESDNVQTYYVRVKSKITKHLENQLGYNFEHNRFNSFHRLDWRLTWSFE